jgi:uncharacterized Tic20 family protein
MKTQTKKSPTKKASTQEKSPVAKKTVPAKKVVSKAKVEKVTPKKTAPVVTPPAPKKVVKKSVPAKKTVPVKKESAPKSETPSTNNTMKTSAKEGVKMLGILHLVGNIFSGGVLGIILVVLYLVIRKNDLSQLEKETCYEIINFNLSFILYTFVAACSMVLLVGFVLLPVVVVTAIVLMVMGFLRHLVGENYKYPFTIRFVS